MIDIQAPDLIGTRVRSSLVGWAGQIGTVTDRVDDVVEVEWDLLLVLNSPAPRTLESPIDLHYLEVRP